MNEDLSFNQLLSMDADDIIATLTHCPPSKQNVVLRQSLSAIESNSLDALVLSRALLIVQSILADGGGSLRSSEYLSSLDTLIALSSVTQDARAKGQSMLAACLVAQRLGKALSNLSKESTERLAELTRSDSDSSIGSRLKALLQHSLDQRTVERPRGTQRYNLPALDISKAQKNVIEDSKQDWYLDPWQWPELRRMTVDSVGERLQSDGCGWTFALDVPKSTDGARPAIILNPVDRTAFQCLADELSLVATSDLPDWVFGWRVKRKNASKGRYEDNSREWKLFKNRIRQHSETRDYVLRIDIRAFFESVNTEELVSNVGRSYKKTAVLDRLTSYFGEFETRRNGMGLPQRSLASSVLAHVPLKTVDNFLTRRQNSTGTSQVTPLRWMDDIWLFGDSEQTLRNVSSEIEAALEQQGLGLNPNKTLFAECASTIDDLLVDTSGLDDNSDEKQREVFTKKLMELAVDIGEAPRSDISFLLKYKGDHAAEIASKVLSTLRDTPLDVYNYAADRFADFLQLNDAWKEHLSWYQTLVRKQADQHSWSIAAWGRMFPETLDNSSESASLRQFFTRRFGEGIQQSLIPLAAHRLASWEGANASDPLLAFLSANRPRHDYFALRSVALAARKAGLSKADVLAVLSDDWKSYSAEVSEIL